MNITWLTIDRSKRAAKHIYEGVKQKTESLVNVKTITRPAEHPVWNQYTRWCDGVERQEQIIDPNEEINTDFIVCDAGFGFIDEALDDIRCKKALIIEDTHGEYVKKYLDRIKDKFDVFFLRYPAAALTRHRWLQEKQWRSFPHSVDVETFRDHEQKRSINVLSVGCLNKRMYPVRTHVASQLASCDGYVKVDRAREGTGNMPTGNDYVDLLNKAKCTISCTAKTKYTVIKSFEIPACGSVLMSDITPDMKALGFEHGKNCINASLEHPKSLVERYIKNDEIRSQIASEGKKLIHERHTTDIRANELIDNLKAL